MNDIEKLKEMHRQELQQELIRIEQQRQQVPTVRPIDQVSIRPIETEAMATIDYNDLHSTIMREVRDAGADIETEISQIREISPDGSLREVLTAKTRIEKDPTPRKRGFFG